MPEEIRIGPTGRARPAVLLWAVACIVTVMAAVAAVWVMVPREPRISLDQALRSYRLRIERGNETLNWEPTRIATRDWAAGSDDVDDCRRYDSRADSMGSSLFAVRLSRTQLRSATGAVVFSGEVGTYGYADTASASQALIRLERLLHWCAASTRPLAECTVRFDTARVTSWKARAHFVVSCAGFGDRSVGEMIQIGNTLTMIDTAPGDDQHTAGRAAETIEQALLQA